MKNYCRASLSFFSFAALLLWGAISSGSAYGMPEAPRKGSLMDPIPGLKDDVYLSDFKNRQKEIQYLDKKKKAFISKMKRWHWLGGKMLNSTPEFFLIWQPSFEKPEQVSEALSFLHRLQPRLRQELGIFLFLSTNSKSHEEKLLAALADAGVALPVVRHEYGDSKNWTRLAHITDAHGVYINMPFNELSDPTAEDIYFDFIDSAVGNIIDEMEDKLGKPFVARFYPTYLRTHAKTK